MRWALWFSLLIFVAACKPPQGGVRVALVFENESATKCVKVTARSSPTANTSSTTPQNINREPGTNTMQIGIGESEDLKGTILVTVRRFGARDCTGAELDLQTKEVTITPGQVAMLEFRYGQASDGGTDAGLDAGLVDVGADAGCDVSSCGAPPACHVGPAACGCTFTNAPRGAACGTNGACNGSGLCESNPCAVLDAGAVCDDGLACTVSSTCQSGTCTGVMCSNSPPACNRLSFTACDPTTPTQCQLTPAFDNSSCGGGKLCIRGDCAKWVGFTAVNLRVAATDLPYPDAGWVLTSTDGGTCDTVISTDGTGSVTNADCGSPPLVGGLDDAGVMVFEMMSLSVGPAVRLQFVGSRPAQLIVIGSATINGTISVAPLAADAPAGANPANCAVGGSGSASQQAGGGGAFGANGGNGGNSGGAGGQSIGSNTPLRGGCSGGTGFNNVQAGMGGGAIELIVADTITMSGGVITASGGGGLGGTGDGNGGGGGGSGGMVVLEAATINLTGAAVTANGGGGGAGGQNGMGRVDGPIGPLSSATAPPAANGGGGNGGVGGVAQTTSGSNGGPGSGPKGGGGGGGSAGVIFIHGASMCTRGNGVISGAEPVSFSCN